VTNHNRAVMTNFTRCRIDRWEPRSSVYTAKTRDIYGVTWSPCAGLWSPGWAGSQVSVSGFWCTLDSCAPIRPIPCTAQGEECVWRCHSATRHRDPLILRSTLSVKPIRHLYHHFLPESSLPLMTSLFRGACICASASMACR
jgi:hypothetical protein